MMNDNSQTFGRMAAAVLKAMISDLESPNVWPAAGPVEEPVAGIFLETKYEIAPSILVGMLFDEMYSMSCILKDEGPSKTEEQIAEVYLIPMGQLLAEKINELVGQDHVIFAELPIEGFNDGVWRTIVEKDNFRLRFTQQYDSEVGGTRLSASIIVASFTLPLQGVAA